MAVKATLKWLTVVYCNSIIYIEKYTEKGTRSINIDC